MSALSLPIESTNSMIIKSLLGGTEFLAQQFASSFSAVQSYLRSICSTLSAEPTTYRSPTAELTIIDIPNTHCQMSSNFIQWQLDMHTMCCTPQLSFWGWGRATRVLEHSIARAEYVLVLGKHPAISLYPAIKYIIQSLGVCYWGWSLQLLAKLRSHPIRTTSQDGLHEWRN